MSVEIRHSKKEDIPEIRDIYAQSSCYAGTLQLPYPSLDKWEKFLGNVPENFYSLVAVVDGKVVGQIGMEVFANPRRKHVSNMGMAVCEEHQKIGVGSSLLEAMLNLAINWLAIRRIELEVYTDNEHAIGLYEKFGFKIEGTAKAYAFRGGEYADVHLMAKVT
ncbi:GNAT family N-acetyltransferase [Microbulbifer sp. A4B17]|uniref:GNAT family N-acetyltransferase n=1 Tax=Microbulbifer sp. A4B17 TaxID=359370 RepID=UPI000D52C1E4|nr:GNAT family N-acetyltransferase [Microbulbifer sp. A4B17]AWF82284.1 GNAT family N-acetyltransferase [Microbulbifer sp. A4B17]